MLHKITPNISSTWNGGLLTYGYAAKDTGLMDTEGFPTKGWLNILWRGIPTVLRSLKSFGDPFDQMDYSGSCNWWQEVYNHPNAGKDYTWYISCMYYQLGDFMSPTTHYRKQKQLLMKLTYCWWLRNILPPTLYVWTRIIHWSGGRLRLLIVQKLGKVGPS